MRLLRGKAPPRPAYLRFHGETRTLIWRRADRSALLRARFRERGRGRVEGMETVYVLVKTKPTLIEPVLKAIQAIPSVVEARPVTGAWDIVVRLEKDYITDALAVVVKEIRAVDGIEATETLVAVN